jgi:hypothetical protein
MRREMRTKPTEQTTQHAIKAYVKPARDRGEKIVRIHVGEIQKELGWTNRTPSVFSTLKSQPFQQQAGLELIEKCGGPPSGGPSTTVEFVYKLLDPSEVPLEQRKFVASGQGLMELCGIFKDAYAPFGGGEEYLRKEREGLHFPAEEYGAFSNSPGDKK